MASSSSSVHAQIIDGLSSSESNSMETDSNGLPFDGVLFGRECRSSDEFSISYTRKFPKSTGQNLQGSLQTVKSSVALYGFSCELNMSYIRNFADKDGKVWQGGGGRNPAPEAPHLVVTTPDIEALRPKSPMQGFEF